MQYRFPSLEITHKISIGGRGENPPKLVSGVFFHVFIEIWITEWIIIIFSQHAIS